MNQPLLEAIEAMKHESGDSDTVVISFSHYLPRQARPVQKCIGKVAELIPAKRR